MVPTFAVVGHPNKGKSSIVATFAQDDTVRISPTPGTTIACRRYPMRVDGEVLYVLVDTPGFQRARRALAWMRERETSVADRPQIVREFVQLHHGERMFADECELLTPALEGAGILYVIDGSRPFGPEYEAEMEILRWTGQPSMALVNMIGTENHIDDWSVALAQYFRIVRQFDVMTAEFDKRIELLRAFRELNEAWREPLDRAIRSLVQDRSQRRRRCAREIGTMLIDTLTLTVSEKLLTEANAESRREAMLDIYRARLKKREHQCRDAVEHIYDYHALERHEPDFDIVTGGLFSRRSWSLFGLSRTQLTMTGAAGGGAVGAGVDAALGGTSLLLGTGIGAIVGAATGWYSYDQLAQTRVLGLPLGGVELRIGPMANRNFPYVVLGRALLHQRLVATRTHARRDSLQVQHAANQIGAQHFPAALRRDFERRFAEIRRRGVAAASHRWRDEFTDMIEAALKHEGANDSAPLR